MSLRRRVTLCLSVPDGGEAFVRFLAGCAHRARSGEHDIDIHATCHNPEMRERLLALDLPIPLAKVHIVERATGSYFQVNSVTHSRCVNALYAGCDADVAVICDYDAIPVGRHWDRVLVEKLLGQDLAFFGSPYAANVGLRFNVGALAIVAAKYQKLPNCIFLAYSPARIRPLSAQLCDFAERYGHPDCLPLRLIATHEERDCYQLPIGSFLNIDTGSQVPGLIHAHRLPFASLERRTDDYLVVKPAADHRAWPELFKPEEYRLDGEPFVVHYRKGGSKNAEVTASMQYDAAAFMADVQAYLTGSGR